MTRGGVDALAARNVAVEQLQVCVWLVWEKWRCGVWFGRKGVWSGAGCGMGLLPGRKRRCGFSGSKGCGEQDVGLPGLGQRWW